MQGEIGQRHAYLVNASQANTNEGLQGICEAEVGEPSMQDTVSQNKKNHTRPKREQTRPK